MKNLTVLLSALLAITFELNGPKKEPVYRVAISHVFGNPCNDTLSAQFRVVSQPYVEENIIENINYKDKNIFKKGKDIVLNSEMHYFLYDVSGKSVCSGKANKISTKNLAPGSYFLLLKKDNELKQKILILE